MCIIYGKYSSNMLHKKSTVNVLPKLYFIEVLVKHSIIINFLNIVSKKYPHSLYKTQDKQLVTMFLQQNMPK